MGIWPLMKPASTWLMSQSTQRLDFMKVCSVVKYVALVVCRVLVLTAPTHLNFLRSAPRFRRPWLALLLMRPRFSLTIWLCTSLPVSLPACLPAFRSVCRRCSRCCSLCPVAVAAALPVLKEGARARARERVYLEQYSTETAAPVVTPDVDNPPPPPSFCFDQYYCKAAMKCREYQIAWYGPKKYLFAED